jgi:hypothetical protein
MYKDDNAVAQVARALGIGLMAGVAGTLAISLSQRIDKKITGQQPSESPVKVAAKVLSVNPTSEEKKVKVSEEVHWAYGTSLGLVRGALCLIGLRGWTATAVHFVTIWAGENIMLPALKVSPSITKLSAKEIAKDGLHHAVYAVAAGLAYDAIDGCHSES